MTSALFIIAGVLNIIAGLIHVWCIAGRDGARYRLLGAGEDMARMADAGKMCPHILTAGIAWALLFFGWLAFGEAGLVPRFGFGEGIAANLGRYILWILTAVYIVRGIGPLLASPFVGVFRRRFWIFSSLLILVFGAVHLAALSGVL